MHKSTEYSAEHQIYKKSSIYKPDPSNEKKNPARQRRYRQHEIRHELTVRNFVHLLDP